MPILRHFCFFFALNIAVFVEKLGGLLEVVLAYHKSYGVPDLSAKVEPDHVGPLYKRRYSVGFEHSSGYVGAYFVAVFCSQYDFHGFVRELRLLLYDEQEVVFLAFLHQDVAVGK